MSYPAVEFVSLSSLRPYTRNARTHSKKQIRQIAGSIGRFGFTNPVLISDDGALHPTVKPVALVADAIKDCSRRGDLVLDPFGGSGTTLIAAQKSGRRARLIEYDPGYCDVIVKRYEAATGDQALLSGTGQAFEDVAEQRAEALGNGKISRGQAFEGLAGAAR
jgi:DNA modification methylase